MGYDNKNSKYFWIKVSIIEESTLFLNIYEHYWHYTTNELEEA